MNSELDDLRNLWKWLRTASVLGLTTVLIITLFFAAGYCLDHYYYPLGNLGITAFILAGTLTAIYYAYRQVSKMLAQFFPPPEKK